MKANPTAYDLLLAYAECVDAYLKFCQCMRQSNMERLQDVLRKHGGSVIDVFIPLDFMNDLRRRALDAARKEAEDEAV